MLRVVQDNLLLLSIILGAFLLRAVGLLHDLPYSYYGDEEHFIKRAVSFGSGDLNPHWFHKPAFYMYLLFGEYGLFFVFGYVVGWFESVEQFAKYYFTDQTYFLVLGRLSTTLFSCGMVYLTYVLGARYFGEKIGLIGAFFLACTYGNFESSIVVKADVPSAFFGLLALYFIMLIFERGDVRDYVLAGLSLGLGAATKFYPLLLWPCLWIAHYIRSHRNKPSFMQRVMGAPLFIALCFFWGVFFIGTPYSFLDPSGSMRNLFSTLAHFLTTGPKDKRTGFTLRESEGVIDKIGIAFDSVMDMGRLTLMVQSMGFILGFVCLIGLGYWVYLICRQDKIALIFFAYIGSYVVMTAFIAPSVSSSRHISLLYPVLCLAGAHIIYDSLVLLLPKFLGIKLRDWMIILCVCILVLPGLKKIVVYDFRALHKDTRLLAKEWIEQNIPSGAKLVVDADGPRLQMSTKKLKELLQRSQMYKEPGPFTTHLRDYYAYQLAAVSEPSYDVTVISHPWWFSKEEQAGTFRLESARDVDMGNPVKERSVMSLAHYKQQGYKYIITDSDDYARYFKEQHQLGFPSVHQFYTDLFSHAQLIKEFRPDSWGRLGPTVKIFEL